MIDRQSTVLFCIITKHGAIRYNPYASAQPFGVIFEQPQYGLVGSKYYLHTQILGGIIIKILLDNTVDDATYYSSTTVCCLRAKLAAIDVITCLSKTPFPISAVVLP